MNVVLLRLCAFVLIILLFPDQTNAMRATTVVNSVACIDRIALDDMLQFTSSGDRDNFSAYINMKRCVLLKGDLDVTVIDSPGMFGGVCSFIFQGFKFWTTRGGLTDYRVDDSEKKVILDRSPTKKTRVLTEKEQAAEWKKAERILNRNYNNKIGK